MTTVDAATLGAIFAANSSMVAGVLLAEALGRRVTVMERVGVALGVAGVAVRFIYPIPPWTDLLGMALSLIGLYLWLFPPDDWWDGRRKQLKATALKVREFLATGVPARRPNLA